MKEKISNERREQIKVMNRFRKQTACLLQGILDKNQFTDAFTKLGTTEPFFNDSCAAVNLRYELNRLVDTFEKMAEYEDLLLTEYYE